MFVKLSVFEKVDLSWLTPPCVRLHPQVNLRTPYEKVKGQQRSRWHWEKLPSLPCDQHLSETLLFQWKASAGPWYVSWSPSNQPSLVLLNYLRTRRCLRSLQVPVLPRCWSKVFTPPSGLTCFYFGVVCSGSDYQIMRLSARRASLWHWSVVTWCLGLRCTFLPQYPARIRHEHAATAEADTYPCWPKSTTGMFSSWLSALNPITESVTYDFNVIR